MIAQDTYPLGMVVGASGITAAHVNGEIVKIPLDAPPAALLPTLIGDQIATDIGGGIDPRGTGLPWPPVARISEEGGAARLPAAIAWMLLEQADRTWHWHPDHARPL